MTSPDTSPSPGSRPRRRRRAATRTPSTPATSATASTSPGATDTTQSESPPEPFAAPQPDSILEPFVAPQPAVEPERPAPQAAPTPRRRRDRTGTEPRPRASRPTPNRPVVTLEGILRVHPRGFAFVDQPNREDESCFVGLALLAGVFDGDLVRVTYYQDDPRPSALKLELVTPERHELVGVIVQSGAQSMFAPDPFLGHGNWRLAASGRTARPGQLVISERERNAVRVVETVGPDGSELALRTRVLVRYGLPRQDAPVSKPAQRQTKLRADSRRRDLRQMTTLTIDADHSTDLDDALSILPADASGGLRFYVHIADVAEVVTPGSATDAVARAAGTSIYLPGWTHHMLPRELAERDISLIPGADRDAISVELRIDPEGEVTAVDVFESRICSDLRLSYSLAAAVLRGRDPEELRGEIDDPHTTIDRLSNDVVEALRWLRTASSRLGLNRARRGGLTARQVEPELSIDRSAAQSEKTSAAHDQVAHNLIERLMVVTNEAIGDWLHERGLPGLWRCHDRPGPDAAAELEQFAEALGYHAGFGPELTPRALAALDAQFAETADRHTTALWDLMLTHMGVAEYRPAPGEHFGLGSVIYTHFTSPIRRYADLVVHRYVKAYLAGRRDTAAWPDAADLDTLARHINMQSRAAKRAEQQMRKTNSIAVLAAEHAQHPRRRYTGRVTGIGERALRITLDGRSLTGNLSYKELSGTWTARGPSAVGPGGRRYTIGQAITVSVLAAEVTTVTLELGTTAPTRPMKAPAPRAATSQKAAPTKSASRKAAPKKSSTRRARPKSK